MRINSIKESNRQDNSYQLKQSLLKRIVAIGCIIYNCCNINYYLNMKKKELSYFAKYSGGGIKI
jgi:hypothetical protein